MNNGFSPTFLGGSPPQSDPGHHSALEYLFESNEAFTGVAGQRDVAATDPDLATDISTEYCTISQTASPKCHGTAHACHEEVTTKASARVGRIAVAGPGCPVLEVGTEYLVENSPR